MRLESYSISSCLALPKMNDMTRRGSHPFEVLDLCPLALYVCTYMRVRIRSNLKSNNSTFY